MQGLRMGRGSAAEKGQGGKKGGICSIELGRREWPGKTSHPGHPTTRDSHEQIRKGHDEVEEGHRRTVRPHLEPVAGGLRDTGQTAVPAIPGVDGDTLRNTGGACRKQASARPGGREGGSLVGSSKTPQRRREDRRNQWGIGPLTEKLDQVDNRGPERGGKRGTGTS